MDFKRLMNCIVSDFRRVQDCPPERVVYILGDALQGKTFVTGILANASFQYIKPEMFCIQKFPIDSPVKFLTQNSLILGGRSSYVQNQVTMMQLGELRIVDWPGTLRNPVMQLIQLRKYITIKNILSRSKKNKIVFVVKQENLLDVTRLEDTFNIINMMIEMISGGGLGSIVNFYNSVVLVINRCSKFSNTESFREYIKKLAISGMPQLKKYENVVTFLNFYSKNGRVQLIGQKKPEKQKPSNFKEERNQLIMHLQKIEDLQQTIMDLQISEKIEKILVEFSSAVIKNIIQKMRKVVADRNNGDTVKKEIDMISLKEFVEIHSIVNSKVVLQSKYRSEIYIKLKNGLQPEISILSILMQHIKAIREVMIDINQVYKENFEQILFKGFHSEVGEIQGQIYERMVLNFVQKIKNIQKLTIRFIKTKIEGRKVFLRQSENQQRNFSLLQYLIQLAGLCGKYNVLVRSLKENKISLNKFIKEYLNLFADKFESIRSIEQSEEFISIFGKKNNLLISNIQSLVNEGLKSKSYKFDQDSTAAAIKFLEIIDLKNYMEGTIIQIIQYKKSAIESILNHFFSKIQKINIGISQLMTSQNYTLVFHNLKQAYINLIKLDEKGLIIFNINFGLRDFINERKKEDILDYAILSEMICELNEFVKNDEIGIFVEERILKLYDQLRFLINRQIQTQKGKIEDIVKDLMNIPKWISKDIDDLMFLTTKYLSIKRNELLRMKRKDQMSECVKIFNEQSIRFASLNNEIKQLKQNNIKLIDFLTRHIEFFGEGFGKYNEIKVTQGYHINFKEKHAIKLLKLRDKLEKQMGQLKIFSEKNFQKLEFIINEISMEEFQESFLRIALSNFKDMIGMQLKSFKEKYYYNPCFIINEYIRDILKISKESNASKLFENIRKVAQSKIELIDPQNEERKNLQGDDPIKKNLQLSYKKFEGSLSEKARQTFLDELKNYIQRNYIDIKNERKGEQQEQKKRLKQQNLELTRKISEFKIKIKDAEIMNTKERMIEKQSKQLINNLLKSLDYIDSYLLTNSKKVEFTQFNSSFRSQDGVMQESMEAKSNRLKRYIFQLKRISCCCFDIFY